VVKRRPIFFSVGVPIRFFRRVSVIRGQVLSPDGLGIVGIRVSVEKNSRFGFTLTRKGGWYVSTDVSRVAIYSDSTSFSLFNPPL